MVLFCPGSSGHPGENKLLKKVERERETLGRPGRESEERGSRGEGRGGGARARAPARDPPLRTPGERGGRGAERAGPFPERYANEMQISACGGRPQLEPGRRRSGSQSRSPSPVRCGRSHLFTLPPGRSPPPHRVLPGAPRRFAAPPGLQRAAERAPSLGSRPPSPRG